MGLMSDVEHDSLVELHVLDDGRGLDRRGALDGDARLGRRHARDGGA